ncbi:ABC transporter substrate-binding protein [Proteiniclasticum ruminis]|uniref:Iron complex transport system substrate-binding protein n=1 Tax=Proteiniclasticum ruminis TaxID=398199 RepID=A0A1I4Y4I0_9CLOT|nr:ABC transporter substrate-binding protein [Proteiniclasticum ruminis]SFN32449.1 iron complex transport system substrate-binding protein [Proteiniclasticum ruminis]
MYKKSKTTNLILALFLVMLVFSGCSGKKAENDPAIPSVETETPSGNSLNTEYPLTITDSTGNEVTIPEKPMNVVSLAPSITETFFALGVEELLVGRTEYCDYPSEVSGIESIGTLQEPNIEKIAELEADLVIASTHFKEEAQKKLEELGITVLVLNPNDSFEGVYDVIGKMGTVLDAQSKAEEIVDSMKEKVSSVEEKVKELSSPSVYYVVGYGEYGDYTAGKGTFISEMIERAGGINVADDVEGWSYSLEKLVEHDPQIILVSKYYETKSGFISTEGYKELTAVKEEKVMEIDSNLIDRQGPRLADGFEALAKAIHQDDFR